MLERMIKRGRGKQLKKKNTDNNVLLFSLCRARILKWMRTLSVAPKGNWYAQMDGEKDKKSSALH